MRVAAVIYAGGRGERLGGIAKAGLRLNGRTLMARVRASLPGSAQLFVSTGPEEGPAIAIPDGGRAVEDGGRDHGGPLAGLAAVVRVCQDLDVPPDALLTVSVDTPFLPDHLFTALLAALPGRSGVVARCGGQAYPTIAAWQLPALAALPEQFAEGLAPHSLKRLAEQQHAGFLDWPDDPDCDAFAGINTLADLLAAQRRARLVETPAS